MISIHMIDITQFTIFSGANPGIAMGRIRQTGRFVVNALGAKIGAFLFTFHTPSLHQKLFYCTIFSNYPSFIWSGMSRNTSP